MCPLFFLKKHLISWGLVACFLNSLSESSVILENNNFGLFMLCSFGRVITSFTESQFPGESTDPLRLSCSYINFADFGRNGEENTANVLHKQVQIYIVLDAF